MDVEFEKVLFVFLISQYTFSSIKISRYKKFGVENEKSGVENSWFQVPSRGE
jgi:hypothetical protein